MCSDFAPTIWKRINSLLVFMVQWLQTLYHFCSPSTDRRCLGHVQYQRATCLSEQIHYGFQFDHTHIPRGQCGVFNGLPQWFPYEQLWNTSWIYRVPIVPTRVTRINFHLDRIASICRKKISGFYSTMDNYLKV